MNDPNAPGPWIWDHAPDYHLTTTEESEKPGDIAKDPKLAQQKANDDDFPPLQNVIINKRYAQ